MVIIGNKVKIEIPEHIPLNFETFEKANAYFKQALFDNKIDRASYRLILRKLKKAEILNGDELPIHFFRKRIRELLRQEKSIEDIFIDLSADKRFKSSLRALRGYIRFHLTKLTSDRKSYRFDLEPFKNRVKALLLNGVKISEIHRILTLSEKNYDITINTLRSAIRKDKILSALLPIRQKKTTKKS